MEHQFMTAAREIREELVGWRRDLHQMPEVGLELPDTSAYIQKELEKMGIPSRTLVNGSCVTALLGKGDKCFLLRADMDALPIREEADLAFAAQNGRMHACGHDLHAAILLGAAKLLKARESELKGVVKLLFQPGEETFEGAAAAIRGGALENPKVDAAFAMHAMAGVPNGVLIYGLEPMSSAYVFRITISGVGGHGSEPSNCVDPIAVGVQIHLALQTLISRECPAISHTALTIGQFQAGDAPNIIPETAVMSGTLRTFDSKVANLIIRRISEIVPAVAAAYRASATVESLHNVPPVVCDPALTELVRKSVEELNPNLVLAEQFHAMGSEDFSFFSQQVPGSYWGLGAMHEACKKGVGHHNPKVLFNEDCLPVGAAAYAKVAFDWLESADK